MVVVIYTVHAVLVMHVSGARVNSVKV